MLRLSLTFYLVLLSCILLYQYLGGMVVNFFINDWVVVDRTNDIIDVFYLLDQLYLSLDEEAFIKVVNAHPENSNIPIHLFNIHDLSLPEKNMEELIRASIYVENPITYEMYYRITNSDLVVGLGPMRSYTPVDSILNIYTQALFFVIAIPIIFLMVSLKRKLMYLEEAAEKFSSGDFEVRVLDQGWHRIGIINQSFNSMVERVGQLVKSHKNLTNAVAHELRTPLSRMRFQLDMLHQEKNNASQEEYIFGISDDLNELVELVDELLNFAKFDREPPNVVLQRQSLHQSILRVIRSRIFIPEIKVIYSNQWFASDDSIQFVDYNAQYLERALGNIVSNAQKYAKSEIKIFVEKTKFIVTIRIEDDGPGISEHERKDVFEPFKRLDNSRTRSTGGHGLGLAIVKQIIYWHKGEVIISSSSAGGTKVVVSLPV